MWKSRKKSAGACTSSSVGLSGTVRCSGPYLKKRILSVVGITPVREKSWPKSAFRKVDLPTFTSPTTTKTKGSFRLVTKLFTIAMASGVPPASRTAAPRASSSVPMLDLNSKYSSPIIRWVKKGRKAR